MILERFRSVLIFLGISLEHFLKMYRLSKNQPMIKAYFQVSFLFTALHLLGPANSPEFK